MIPGTHFFNLCLLNQFIQIFKIKYQLDIIEGKQVKPSQKMDQEIFIDLHGPGLSSPKWTFDMSQFIIPEQSLSEIKNKSPKISTRKSLQQSNNQVQEQLMRKSSKCKKKDERREIARIEEKKGEQEQREKIAQNDQQQNPINLIIQKIILCVSSVQQLHYQIYTDGRVQKNIRSHLLQKVINIIQKIIKTNINDFKFESFSEFLKKNKTILKKYTSDQVNGGQIVTTDPLYRFPEENIGTALNLIVKAFQKLKRKGKINGKWHHLPVPKFLESLLNPYNQSLNTTLLNHLEVKKIDEMVNFLNSAKDLGYNLEVAKILFKARICEFLMKQKTQITQLVFGLKLNTEQKNYACLIVVEKYLNKFLKDLAPQGKLIGSGLFDSDKIIIKKLRCQMSFIEQTLKEKEQKMEEEKKHQSQKEEKKIFKGQMSYEDEEKLLFQNEQLQEKKKEYRNPVVFKKQFPEKIRKIQKESEKKNKPRQKTQTDKIKKIAKNTISSAFPKRLGTRDLNREKNEKGMQSEKFEDSSMQLQNQMISQQEEEKRYEYVNRSPVLQLEKRSSLQFNWQSNGDSFFAENCQQQFQEQKEEKKKFQDQRIQLMNSEDEKKPYFFNSSLVATYVSHNCLSTAEGRKESV